MTPVPVDPAPILAELVQIATAIEGYRTAIWILERKRDELRGQLQAQGFTP